MEQLRVLVVGPAKRESGGIARYISEQRRHLNGRLDVDLFDTDTAPVDGTLSLLRGGIDTVSGWLKFPFARRPDVVHVHSSHYHSFYLSSFYVFYAAYVWKCPVILHVHGSSFDEFVRDASGLSAAFQSAVFGAADVTIVLSEYWQEVLSARSDDDKIRVLPNAVAHDEYEPSESVAVPHVVFVSNHVERKGIREMTEAVARLYDQGLDFRTTIAGSGPLSEHAERLAAQYEDVTYLGFISEAEKRQLLGEASVYVLPTYAEGLPIAILEAMAGGNAVLSTTVGSISSIVDDANGILVPPGDVDALTLALEQLVTDSDRTRAMGVVSRDRVVSTYSWDRIADALVSLYHRVSGIPEPSPSSKLTP